MPNTSAYFGYNEIGNLLFGNVDTADTSVINEKTPFLAYGNNVQPLINSCQKNRIPHILKIS